MNVQLGPIAYAEEAFGPMLAEAGQGSFLLRLRDEWLSGAVRFDRDGEVLLGARADGVLAGVGGISRDPYSSEAGLGRLRHLYVLGPYRGRGIAGALVAALLAHARGRFAVLRLRTGNEVAARLYERAGFVRSDGESETHRITLGEPVPVPQP